MGDHESDLQARRADSADVSALRRFRCDKGGWFARDVQALIRGRVASAVGSGDPIDVLLFERSGELMAVAALEIDENEPLICDLHAVAITNDHQGSYVQTPAGQQPLVKAVLDTALAVARELGARRIQTIVARDNARSLRMLAREGFVRVRAFDRDYDEWVARLE